MGKRERSGMRVMLTLRPGQRGTKALMDEYGERLIYVRYRYDAKARQRHKTVEIIIDSAEWTPPHAPDEIVSLAIDWREGVTIAQIRLVGGRRGTAPDQWLLRYDLAVALGLADRIVE
jgi:hypothetical protein